MSKEVNVRELIDENGDLKQLNGTLTKLMATRTIHSAIEGSKLHAVVDLIVAKAASNDEDRILGAAVLGRLANVARNRSEIPLEASRKLFSSHPPASLECLGDGDERYYASLAISRVSANWLTEYCFTEALATDTSEKARKELLAAALRESGNLTQFFRLLSQHTGSLSLIDSPDSRSKRIRRIFDVISDICNEWKGECGQAPGPELAKLISSLPLTREGVEESVLTDIADDVIETMLRIIQLRFSFALLSNSYEVMNVLKRKLGHMLWNTYVRQSHQIAGIRVCLLESVLVLARQNKTDDAFVSLLTEVYGNLSAIKGPLEKQISNAQDIDPDIRKWWSSGGKKPKDQNVPEHKTDSSVDQQIGALMIEVFSAKAPMEKLSSAVVPMLGISEPVLAASVKCAANGYVSIDRIMRQLASMRKLQLTDTKGERLEYNPMEHEMLGGHRTGVRLVKVVRDGVQKDFAGSTKTLVKAWVEPIKE